MRQEEEDANEVVLPSVFSALASHELANNGKKIHGLAFRNGLL